MLIVAIVSAIAALVAASIAYHHWRDHSGEHRPWSIATGALLGLTTIAGLAYAAENPGALRPAPDGAPITITTAEVPETTAPTGPTPTPAPRAPVVTPTISTWHKVGTYSGSGNGSTPVFKVRGKAWRFFWDIKQSTTTGRFSYLVYKSGSSQPVSQDAYVSGIDREVRLFEPGEYRIGISAESISWTLRVEDKYVGTDSTKDASAK